MNGILTYVLRFFWPLLGALALTACGPSSNSIGANISNDTNAGGIVLDEPVIDNAVQPIEAAAATESFLDAARQRLIEYEVVGLDASSGDSLRIRVRRLAARPIRLRIAPGTVFATGSRGVQRMAAFSVSGEVETPGSDSVRPTDTIDLDTDGFREFILKAYCLDFELENPSPGNRFQAQSVDNRAAAILAAANQQGLGVAATQAAIWLDRGVTGEEIRQKFEVTDQDLAQAGQLLAGLPRA